MVEEQTLFFTICLRREARKVNNERTTTSTWIECNFCAIKISASLHTMTTFCPSFLASLDDIGRISWNRFDKRNLLILVDFSASMSPCYLWLWMKLILWTMKSFQSIFFSATLFLNWINVSGVDEWKMMKETATGVGKTFKNFFLNTIQIWDCCCVCHLLRNFSFDFFLQSTVKIIFSSLVFFLFNFTSPGDTRTAIWHFSRKKLIFFSLLFRLWSSGCRSRYQGGLGRMKFLKRPFCIIGEILQIETEKNDIIWTQIPSKFYRFNHYIGIIDCNRNGNIRTNVCCDDTSRSTFFPNPSNGPDGSTWWNVETSGQRRLCTQTSKRQNQQSLNC